MKVYVINKYGKNEVVSATSPSADWVQHIVCEAPRLGNGHMTDVSAMDFSTDEEGVVTASINEAAFIQSQSNKAQDQENGKWDSFRDKRNAKLSECDWTQVEDTPVSDPDAWANYRQELRDLPDNIEDINNIVWPEKP